MKGGGDMGETRDKWDLLDVARLLKNIYESEDSKAAAKREHEFIMDKLAVAGVTDVASVKLAE